VSKAIPCTYLYLASLNRVSVEEWIWIFDFYKSDDPSLLKLLELSVKE